MGGTKWMCRGRAWAWMVMLWVATFPGYTQAWIPFIGEETHKHLDLLSHHKEWDVLELLNINGSQTGVSEVRGPIPGMKAWRLRAVFDNIHLDPAVVEQMRTHLQNEFSMYFVYKQHKKTIGSLLSVNMPGKIKPWFQVISNLKTRRLNVFYHVKEDTKTHQASFHLPEKVGWTWTRLLLTLNGTQARAWTNCGDYDKQQLAGHVDLQIPEGGLLYFRQEPGLKNKLVGNIQVAKVFNFSMEDRLWLCHFDDQFGPVSDEAECEAVITELDRAYDAIDIMKIKEQELLLIQEEEKLKMELEMATLKEEMESIVNGFAMGKSAKGPGHRSPVSGEGVWRRGEDREAEEVDGEETRATSGSNKVVTQECKCEGGRGDVCKHEGQLYRRGQPWEPDACTICRCEEEGQVMCQRKDELKCRDPCWTHPCAEGSSCVVHPGHPGFKCLCSARARGPRCQHHVYPCAPLGDGSSQKTGYNLRKCDKRSLGLRYEYQPVTMLCQESIVCDPDLGYPSLAECEQGCLSGVCCFQYTSANHSTCQSLTLKACKTMHESRDVIVTSYTPRANQEPDLAMEKQKKEVNAREVGVEDGSSSSGRCPEDAPSSRREVRRLPSSLMRKYLRGFGRLIEDGTLTKLATDYGRAIMLANSQELWLEWQRALLDHVENVLQETSGCQLAIPYWDFTTHARDVKASPIFSSNYFDDSTREEDDTWGTFVNRDVMNNSRVTSVAELAHVLSGAEKKTVRAGLWRVQTKVMAALGGSALSHDSILDPVVMSLFAFVDKLWRTWQQRFPAPPPKYATSFYLDPFGIRLDAVWFPNTSRITYMEPEWKSKCSSDSPSEEKTRDGHEETDKNFPLNEFKLTSGVVTTTDEQRGHEEPNMEEIPEEELPALTSTLLRLFMGLPVEVLELIQANDICESDHLVSSNAIENEMDTRLEKWRAIVWREKTEAVPKMETNMGATSDLKKFFTRYREIKGTSSLCINPDITNWRRCAGPCPSQGIPNKCSGDTTSRNDSISCPAFPRAQPRINVCGPSCGLEWTVQGSLVNCVKTDPCQPNPCANGGECQGTPSPMYPQGFECYCKPEFEGPKCQHSKRPSCYLPVERGSCPPKRPEEELRPVLLRWYYDATAGDCKAFGYTGCGGNGNSYISHSACVDACNVGTCCFRTRRRWGAKLLQEEKELEAETAAAEGMRSGAPYGHALRGLINILSSMSSSRYADDTAHARYNDDGRDADGYDCWGRDRWGRDRKGRLGGWDTMKCRQVRRTECTRTKDAPDQFQVVSFMPNASEMSFGGFPSGGGTVEGRQQWLDMKGKRCGCFYFGEQYEVGEIIKHPCLQLRCQPGGGIEFSYHALAAPSLVSPTHRREIRDLTLDDMRVFQKAVARLADSQTGFNWKYLTDMYAKYLPHFAGSDYFLPWHRYLLRLVESKMMTEVGCQFSIPYFDWTIDVGDMAKSTVWQANYFGGQGEGQSLCVRRHPFMPSPTSVFRVECLRRKFDEGVSLPDAVNVAYLMTIRDYREFRMQLETMSGLFQLFVGGHMATPERIYDPLFLSHATFIDKLWQDWLERRNSESYEKRHNFSDVAGDLDGKNISTVIRSARDSENSKKDGIDFNGEDSSENSYSRGVSKTNITKDNTSETHERSKRNEGNSDIGRRERLSIFPRQLRFDHMEPFGVSPNDVLDSPSKMKVLYLPVGEGFPCRSPTMEGEEELKVNATKAYDHEGFDAEGYSRFGFDSIGYDREGYDVSGYNRDGFNQKGFDRKGYNRYGLKLNGCTSFGPPYCKGIFNISETSALTRKLFDTNGYNKQGFNLLGLDRRGFDAFGFTTKGYDKNTCNFYNRGPFFVLRKAKLEAQLGDIDDPGKFLNIKRACPAVSLVPVWWLQNNYFSPEDVQALRRHEKTQRSLRPVLTLPDSSQGDPSLSPQERFCLQFDPYSICPLGSRVVECDDVEERLCEESQCLAHPRAICRVLGCNGTCAAMFYDGITGEKVDCEGCQDDDGYHHPEGATWQSKSCQECQCHAGGQVMCHPVACREEDVACSHPVHLDGICCPSCHHGCLHGGRVVAEGAVVSGRGVCEECVCEGGSLFCERQVCPTLNCSVENIVRHPSSCCGECVECEGRQENERWQPNPCVLCKCIGNSPKCHAFDCPPVECQHPLAEEGSCCPECHHCSYEGQELRHGQQLQLSACWTCTCHSGTVNCSHEMCPPPACPVPVEVEGECCPICPGECRYDQRTLSHGAIFTPSYNPCLNCSCLKGRVRCSPITCGSPPCQGAIAPPGECCPVVCPTDILPETVPDGPIVSEDNDDLPAGSPFENPVPSPCVDEEGRTHYHGARWLYPMDPCQICECYDGETKCKNDHSQCPLQCQHGIVPPGQCCPACRDCFFQGQVVSEGSSLIGGPDPCTKCHCQAGTMRCSTEKCSPLRCLRVEHPSGECCPKCAGCADRGGIRREHGSTWTNSEDPCQTCRCNEGIIRCERKQCHQLECSNPVPPSPSECCPQCGGGCLYHGILYPHLHKTPSRDPCATCTCFEGNVECETIRCSDVYCEDPEIPPGECCPVCSKCVYLGTTYTSGEEFTPPTEPCMECTCMTGQVRCESQEHLCNPQCRHPATPPSQCCPMCDDCLFQDKVYENGEEFLLPDADAENGSDPCTVCQCLHGEVRCVALICLDLECSNAKIEPGECCPSCPPLPSTLPTLTIVPTTRTPPPPSPSPPTCLSLHGLQRKEGEVWVDEEDHCRICKCRAERTECFPRPCPPPACLHPAIPDGGCCPECLDCFYTLRHFQSGQNFVHHQDPCQECHCQNGTVTCRTKICPPLACEVPLHIPSDCCPFCPLARHCTHLGVTYNHGTVFPDPQDECQECECHEGTTTCRPKQCPPYACPNPAQRTCCPDCLGCSYSGRNQEDNATFSDPTDPCRTCLCRKGYVTCRTTRCPATSCVRPTHLPDTCCPVCRECEHEGRMYEDGLTFASEEDPCVECRCDYPEVKCFPKYCPLTHCTYPAPEPGGCCRRCDKCLFEGKEYYNGQHFMDPTDQCAQCSCRMGNVQCTRLPCETRTSCPFPVPGPCCPECGSGCYYQNQTLSDGATFPDELVPCQECLCHGGFVTCASKRCETVTCSHPVTQDCCPSCSSCLFEDRIIENGLRFAHPSLECHVCECIEGNVTCQPIQCPEVDCHSPRIVNCCPVCELGCRVGNLRLMDGMVHHPKDRPCQQCVCREGQMECERRPCPVLTCPEQVQGKCCPRCTNDSTCLFEDEIYLHEEVFTDIFSCQDCLCLSGVVHCIPVDCPALDCVNKIIPPDDCCPACDPSCTHEGVTYPSGMTFRHLDQQCKSCSCVDGELNCKDLECPPVFCTHPQLPRIPPSSPAQELTMAREDTKVGEVGAITPAEGNGSNLTTNVNMSDDPCCPSCSGCSYKGQDFENGQQFNSSCESCICQSGSVTCTTRPCLPVPCPNPVRLRGSCCPSCPGCIFKKQLIPIEYKFLHPDDPCRLCHCQPNEEVICSKVPCPQNPSCKNGQILGPPPEGKCCPVCFTNPLRNLEKEGKEEDYEELNGEDEPENEVDKEMDVEESKVPHYISSEKEHIKDKLDLWNTKNRQTGIGGDFEGKISGKEHTYGSLSPKDLEEERREPVEVEVQVELNKEGDRRDSENNIEDQVAEDELHKSRDGGTSEDTREKEGKKEEKEEEEKEEKEEEEKEERGEKHSLLSALEDSDQVLYIFDGDEIKIIKEQPSEADTTNKLDRKKVIDIISPEILNKDHDSSDNESVITIPSSTSDKVPGKSKVKFKVKLRVSKIPGKTATENGNEESASPDTSFLQEVPLIVKNFKPVVFKPGCDKNKEKYTNETVAMDGDDNGDNDVDYDDEEDNKVDVDHTVRNILKHSTEGDISNKEGLTDTLGILIPSIAHYGREKNSLGTDRTSEGTSHKPSITDTEKGRAVAIDTQGYLHHDMHTNLIPTIHDRKGDNVIEDEESPWFTQSRVPLTMTQPLATRSSHVPDTTPSLFFLSSPSPKPQSSRVPAQPSAYLEAAPELYVIRKNASLAHTPLTGPSSITSHSTSEEVKEKEEVELPLPPPTVSDQFSTSSSTTSQVLRSLSFLTDQPTLIVDQSIRSPSSSTRYLYHRRRPIATIAAPTSTTTVSTDDVFPAERTQRTADDKEKEKVQKEKVRTSSEMAKNEREQAERKERMKEQLTGGGRGREIWVGRTEEEGEVILEGKPEVKVQPVLRLLEAETDQTAAAATTGGNPVESSAKDTTTAVPVLSSATASEMRTGFPTPDVTVQVFTTESVADLTFSVSEPEITTGMESTTKVTPTSETEFRTATDSMTESEVTTDDEARNNTTTVTATITAFTAPTFTSPISSVNRPSEYEEAASSRYIPPTATADTKTTTTATTVVFAPDRKESVTPLHSHHSHHNSSHLSSSLQSTTSMLTSQTPASLPLSLPQFLLRMLLPESSSTTLSPSQSTVLSLASSKSTPSPVSKHLLQSSQSTKPSPSESSHSLSIHEQVTQLPEPKRLPHSSPHIQLSQSPQSTPWPQSLTSLEPLTSQLPKSSQPTQSSLTTELTQPQLTELPRPSTSTLPAETSQSTQRLRPTQPPSTTDPSPPSETVLGCDPSAQRDPCLNCTCNGDGVWMCKALSCPELVCPPQETYTPEGECCPRCAGCEVEVGTHFRLYGDGERWHSPADPCITCVCRKGVPICNETHPECRAAPDKVREDHNSRSNDRCINVSCENTNCPHGEEARLVPGACCPLCAPLSSRCVWWGGHVRTFDGLLLRRAPGCGLTLLRTRTRPVASVTATFTSDSQKLLVKVTVGHESMEVVSREKEGPIVRTVEANETMPYFPKDMPTFAVYAKGKNVFVSTVVGVQVVIGAEEKGNDPLLEVLVGGEHGGEIEGVCGNLNTYPQDDLTLPSGDFTQDASGFMKHWSVGENCPPPSSASSCDFSYFILAERMCNVLKSSLFRACHRAVPPEPYMRTCSAEVCECHSRDITCLCPTLRLYALLCARAGVTLAWRHPNLCPATCPSGMEWSECTAPCGRPAVTCERSAEVRSSASSHPTTDSASDFRASAGSNTLVPSDSKVLSGVPPSPELQPEVSSGVRLWDILNELIKESVERRGRTSGTSRDDFKRLKVTESSEDDLVRVRRESWNSKFDLVEKEELCPGPCVSACVCPQGTVWDGKSCVQEKECGVTLGRGRE